MFYNGFAGFVPTVFERGVYRMVGKGGENEWAPDENGPHVRITEKLPKAEVGRIIDELIMRKPKGAAISARQS